MNNKTCYIVGLNGKIHDHSFQIGGWGNGANLGLTGLLLLRWLAALRHRHILCL